MRGQGVTSEKKKSISKCLKWLNSLKMIIPDPPPSTWSIPCFSQLLFESLLNPSLSSFWSFLGLYSLSWFQVEFGESIDHHHHQFRISEKHTCFKIHLSFKIHNWNW